MLRAARDESVVFLHVPKTGGKTLKHIMHGQYRTGLVDIRGDNPVVALEEFTRLPEHARAEVRCLMGHVPFGVHVHLPRPTRYITILRDPVDRVVSHYYYLRNRLRGGADISRSPWLREAAELDLKTYAERGGSADLRNGQTKMIAGVAFGWGRDTGDDPPGLLETAKENLRAHIAVVGLTERFDESLMLYRSRLGWRIPVYTRQKVTRGKPRRDEIPQATLDAIAAHNQLDQELYRYGAELFEQALADHASIARDVRTFQLVNAAYGRLKRVQSSVHYRLKALRAR